MKYVYLAGPIAGLTHDEARYGWRQEAANKLAEHNIGSYSPMRGKDSLKNVGKLGVDGYSGDLLTTPQSVLARDFNDCQMSDLILMNFLGAEKPSIGSICEVAWAHALRKPLITCMEPRKPVPAGPGKLNEWRNCHDHLFIQAISAVIAPTLEEGILAAVTYLKPGV